MAFLFRILLLPAALLRGTWLRLRGRPGPDFGDGKQWHGRFRLAVWLAVVFLSAGAVRPEPPMVTCYEQMPPKDNPLRPLSRVRLMWMALDPKQGQALASALTASTYAGDVEIQVSNLLLRIHGVLADHRNRTRDPRITCYRMSAEGTRRIGHREAVLAQLEALTKVRKMGRVAPEVLARAASTMKVELSQLGLEPPPNEKDLQEAARILTDWYAE